jgi:hypothetical protein
MSGSDTLVTLSEVAAHIRQLEESIASQRELRARLVLIAAQRHPNTVIAKAAGISHTAVGNIIAAATPPPPT